MNAYPWLEIHRTVRFSDTDAAGVMHFQALLGWAHQAWEESLERYGLEAGSIFPGGRETPPGVALPIIHCSADFRAPLQMGDVVSIQLEPKRQDQGSFEVVSRYHLNEREIARACLRHLAIDAVSRSRCELPEGLDRWLEASCLGQINPL